MYPSALATLSNTQEMNALRAERAYHNSLQQALEMESGSAVSSWRMDKFDGR